MKQKQTVRNRVRHTKRDRKTDGKKQSEWDKYRNTLKNIPRPSQKERQKNSNKRDTQKQTEKRETEHASSQRTVTHLLLWQLIVPPKRSTTGLGVRGAALTILGALAASLLGSNSVIVKGLMDDHLTACSVSWRNICYGFSSMENNSRNEGILISNWQRKCLFDLQCFLISFIDCRKNVHRIISITYKF